MNHTRIDQFFESTLLEAAKVCRTFLAESPLEVAKKSDGQYITALDHHMDQWFKNHLLTCYPDHHWISEESQSIGQPGKGMTWLVDPIDGTKYLVQRGEDYTMVMALLDGSRVCAAGVINPQSGAYWVSTDDEHVVHFSQDESKFKGTILVSHTTKQMHFSKQPLMYAMGSIAQRICVCVTQHGLAALSFHVLPEWDVLPAAYIATRYGYGVYDLAGEPYDLVYEGQWQMRKGLVVVKASDKEKVFEIIGQRRI